MASTTEPLARIRRWLTFLYGENTAAQVWPLLSQRLEAFQHEHPHLQWPSAAPGQQLTEHDAILITYGDQLREPGRPPLQTLRDFLNLHLRDVVSGVHLLPCFPYSSDDGFSVVDYLAVDPALGTWEDVADLARDYRLMFDFVANHISQHSAWFQAYRRGEAPYDRFFIEADPAADLSQVVRPRTTPLLTPVETAHGTRHVWTTFSADQVDLNYANPAVLLAMTDVLLHYVAHGAEIIRLDAIAYLWKEAGTPCIHLPQTHAVVKLWRAVLDAVAPHVLLITETNVPHADNVRYFGEPLGDSGRTDEAQMVYNFSLAPLVLHTFLTGDASKLSAWAATLQTPAPGAAFFNFIASHDGIGVLPAQGLLESAEVERLVERTLAHGGQVSYRTLPDGRRSVYELNVTLYDFFNDPARPHMELDVRRFLASQAILLALAGVPGIYVHSLFGSRSCHACFQQTGHPRSLNREKFQRKSLEVALADPQTHTYQVFQGYRRLLRARRGHPTFNPVAEQQVLTVHPAVFALARTTPDRSETLLSLVNVSGRPVMLDLPLVRWRLPSYASWRDLLSGAVIQPEGGHLRVGLESYRVAWLTPVSR